MRGVTWKLATKKLQSAIKLLRHYPQRHYVFLIMYISEGKIRLWTQPLPTLLAQQCCERLHVARRLTTGFKLC